MNTTRSRNAIAPTPAPLASLAGRAGAVALGIVPRAAKLPADINGLLAVATLAFCPVRGAERRVRADHIAVMISDELVAAGL